MKFSFVVLVAAVLGGSTLPARGAGPGEVEGYRDRVVHGWPVRVSERLLRESPEKTDRALELLGDQVERLRAMLPKPAFDKVCDITIWLSPPYEGHGPTGEYHPGAEWLRKNGRPAELHRCIEFTNVERYEDEIRRMPVLLLHEVAHAYHDQQLGFDHPEIAAAYQRAKASARYERVERHDGVVVEHYALTNPMEYFAELSESYFGVNDYFPFNREQLEVYDPTMFALLERVWNLP
ncbi:MAG: hypothetical protein AAFU85_29420 [Planctomycetota bacterium]